jgi:Nuclease-related domain
VLALLHTLIPLIRGMSPPEQNESTGRCGYGGSQLVVVSGDEIPVTWWDSSSSRPEPPMNSSAGPEWNDLASNKPGAAAGARAAELRSRHPFLVSAAKVLGIRTESGSFAIGAKGERLVGRKLNRWATQNGWQVLHAIPVSPSGTDIDHVIVGSFGVVTVNTKATKTRVWIGEHGMTVGGKTVDHLRKSRAEAARAAQLLTRATGLEVPVQPVIVFTGGGRFSVHRGGPRDVAVLPSPRTLHRWLRKQPAVLTDADVKAVYQAARDPGTWQPRGRPPR